jgi:hypothetical protein
MFRLFENATCVEKGDALTCVLTLLERLTPTQLDVLRVAHIVEVQRRNGARAAVWDADDRIELGPAITGAPAEDGTVGEADEDGDEVLDPTPL